MVTWCGVYGANSFSRGIAFVCIKTVFFSLIDNNIVKLSVNSVVIVFFLQYVCF